MAATTNQPRNAEDAEVLKGGPGSSGDPAAGSAAPPAPKPAAADPQDEPRRVKRKIGGRELELDPDVADAIDEREREYARGYGNVSQELAELKRRLPAPAPPPKPAEPDWNTLMFDRPAEAVGHIRREINEQVSAAKSELETRYESERRRERFWATFYRANPDLAGEELLVDSILQRDQSALSPLPVEEGQSRLADAVRKEILRIARVARERDSRDDEQPVPQRRASVEGARETTEGQRGRRQTAEREDEGPTSITEALRERRAARLKGTRTRTA